MNQILGICACILITIVFWGIGKIYFPKKPQRLINEFCGRLLPEVNDPGWKLDTSFYSRPCVLVNGKIKVDGSFYPLEHADLYVDKVLIESSYETSKYYRITLQPFLDKIKQEKQARYNNALDTLPKA